MKRIVATLLITAALGLPPAARSTGTLSPLDMESMMRAMLVMAKMWNTMQGGDSWDFSSSLMGGSMPFGGASSLSPWSSMADPSSLWSYGSMMPGSPMSGMGMPSAMPWGGSGGGMPWGGFPGSGRSSPWGAMPGWGGASPWNTVPGTSGTSPWGTTPGVPGANPWSRATGTPGANPWSPFTGTYGNTPWGGQNAGSRIDPRALDGMWLTDTGVLLWIDKGRFIMQIEGETTGTGTLQLQGNRLQMSDSMSGMSQAYRVQVTGQALALYDQDGRSQIVFNRVENTF